MREWVVGFLFDMDAQTVVLIRKNRPEWQRGRLNGVGGKVEPGEFPVFAMVREFHEETGVRVTAAAWHRFACLRWEEGVVHFFRAFVGTIVLDACRSMTDEPVGQYDVAALAAVGPERLTPNLRWLVPLAAHRHDTYDLIDVVEMGTTLRKPGRLDVLPGSPKATP